eukprot:900535_1
MSNWCELASFELKEFEKPNGINAKHFLIVNSNGVFKYSISMNKWTKEIDTPKQYTCKQISTAINRDTERLYIFDPYGNLSQIELCNVNNNKWDITNKLIALGSYARAICIRNELHVIG